MAVLSPLTPACHLTILHTHTHTHVVTPLYRPVTEMSNLCTGGRQSDGGTGGGGQVPATETVPWGGGGVWLMRRCASGRHDVVNALSA